MKPSVGRIIHVHMVDAPRTKQRSGRCTAAIVTYVDGDTFDVVLFIPKTVGDFRCDGLNTSEEGKAWHWPERES